MVGIDIFALWLFRIGFLLLIISVLLPSKAKKTVLSKVFKKKPALYYNEVPFKLVSYLDKLTESSVFRSFMLKENSDEYVRLEDLILQMERTHGLTPNIIQLLRLLLPPVFFVFALALYVYKTTSQAVNLNVGSVQQVISDNDAFAGLLQPAVIVVRQDSGGFSWIVVMWIFIGCMLLYMLPELILKMRVNARKAVMKKELPVMETFVIIMLETGSHTVYDILKTLLDTTVFFKPYITACLNEYYIDPKRAIQNMAEKINDEGFQIICNGLKQAVDVDKKYTVTFMKQHLDQLKKLQDLQREANIKKKPLVYVFLLALPLINIVIIWFYPWFTRAMKMLTTGF